MRLGSWLLGLGGRIGGVGAWESGGKLDMAEKLLGGRDDGERLMEDDDDAAVDSGLGSWLVGTGASTKCTFGLWGLKLESLR